ncbi:MAG: ABC transporter permease [Lachnospiraceae bacterium]|nr:ABC transporter permease [Lachnospiraceae bacterium]
MKNPLIKRVPRELKGEWRKYLVIFLFLTLVIGFVSGMYVANKSMLKAADESVEKYNREDGYLQFSDPASDELIAVLEENDVKIYENFFKQTDEELSSTKTEIEIRVYKINDEVDKASILKGRLPEAADEIAIDRMHADNQNIKVGDTIKVGGNDFKVTGLVALVNYSTLYKSASDTMFDAITFDVGIVTKEGFEKLDTKLYYRYAWTYNDKPEDDKEKKQMGDDFMEKVVEASLEYGAQIEEFVPAYINQAIIFATSDMGKDMAMGGVLLDILIVVLAFIFAITINNTIAKESAVIGTLRASGYTRGELVRHYMTMPVLVTLIAAIVGNILGYTLFKDTVVNMYYNSYSLPAYETVWSSEAFLKTTVIPVIIMFFVNLFVIVKKLKLSPLRFIRRDLKKTKRKKAMRLPRWKFLARFKTRIFLQNLPNYFVLLLGISFVSIMMSMAIGMPQTLKYYQDHVDDMMFAKYQVMLKYDTDIMGNEITTDVEGAEKINMTELVRLSDVYDEDVSVYGFSSDSRYIKIKDDFGENEVYISTAYEGKYKVKVGDKIKLDEKYENKNYEFKVIGIYDYDGGIAVFMPNDNYTKVFDKKEGSFNCYISDNRIDDIDENYIIKEITEKDIKKMADQLDHSMGAYMTYFQYLCIILSAVLIYLLTKIIIEKNENPISMVKILGYNTKEISSLYIQPTTWVVLISDFIGAVAGYFVIDAMWKKIIMQLGGWFAFTMNAAGFAKEIIFIFISYLIVMLIDVKRIKKVPMDTALKNVE